MRTPEHDPSREAEARHLGIRHSHFLSRALACSFVVLAWCVNDARAQNASSTFPVANANVTTQVISGNTLYIAGFFTAVGPASGAGVPLDITTGASISGFPKVAGIIYAVASDGAGGWFIGGAFSSVGGVPRSNLAHILADNSVSAWNPAADAEVDALIVNGSTVYVGGYFGSVGGQSRSSIGAVDAATGVATSWNPTANNSINVLAVAGSTVLVGGNFDTIGRHARS